MKKLYAFLAIIIINVVFGACDYEIQQNPYDPRMCNNVIYLGNGNTSGSCPSDSTLYIYGATVTVLGNTSGLAKSGYSFVGWNTESDGSGTNYTQGSTLIMGSNDVALYANWTNLPVYTVAYNGNGNTLGSIPASPVNYLQGDTVTVLGNTSGLVGSIIQDGIRQRFVRWNTQSGGGGTNYSASSTFTITQNTTLYAIYTTDSSTIAKVGPAGGWIFYDKGSYSGSPSWRYMEASASSAGGASWSSAATLVLVGASGTAIGTGQQNTAAILSGDTTTNAARICANYSVVYNGITYDDWFLLSYDELSTFFSNLSGTGAYSYSTGYWTSSESSATKAWLQTPTELVNTSKYSNAGVRPIRIF